MKKELEKKNKKIEQLMEIQNDNLHGLKFSQKEKRDAELKMQEMQFEINELKTENTNLSVSIATTRHQTETHMQE